MRTLQAIGLGQDQQTRGQDWWSHHIANTRIYAERALAHDTPAALDALKELWKAVLDWKKITGCPMATALMAEHTMLAKLLVDCFAEGADSDCTDVVIAAVGRNVDATRKLFPKEPDEFADLFGEHSTLAGQYITDLAKQDKDGFDVHFAAAIDNGQELAEFTDRVLLKPSQKNTVHSGAMMGQVPLVLGPSSWGYGMPFLQPQPLYNQNGTPPYWGEWCAPEDCGKEGPFDTIDEAFSAAAAAARENGAEALPRDGFAQVKDSRGRLVGPVT